MRLRAVFWDLDGTLVDSEPHWMASEIALVKRFGGTWTREDALSMVGQPLSTTIRLLMERGVALSFEETEAALMEEMRGRIAAEGIPFRPGARELAEALAERGTVQALVTMSYGPYLDAVLPWLPGLSHVQSGDSVARGKPAPDIYLAAMKAVGATAEESLAIEDSASGTGAILAAGVTPVAVPALAPILDDPRLIVLNTLDGVTPDTLDELHREWQGR